MPYIALGGCYNRLCYLPCVALDGCDGKHYIYQLPFQHELICIPFAVAALGPCDLDTICFSVHLSRLCEAGNMRENKLTVPLCFLRNI